MGARDKLREVMSHVLERLRSHGPDSYFEYKRKRERERKQAERGRDDAERSAEREREQAERGREHAERYAAERTAKEPQTDAPREDTSKPD
jgi:hypothetical protein